MGELSVVEIQAKIDAINAQLESLVAAPSGSVDVQALDVRIANSQKWKFLQEERKFWEEQLRSIPSADWFYPISDGDAIP